MFLRPFPSVHDPACEELLCSKPKCHLSSQHVNTEIMARVPPGLAPAEVAHVQEETSWTLRSNAKEQLKREAQNKGVI